MTLSGAEGSAIILLADKSGSGEVKYQATANFNSDVATATLPDGVNVNNYVITVLFTGARAKGGNLVETIAGSYTYSGLADPENSSDTNVQYCNGGDLSFKLLNVDTDSMDIGNVTYAGLNNATTLPASTSAVTANSEWTLTAREVGKYTVKIKPKTDKTWADGTQDEKEYEFYIKHKVANPIFSSNSSSTLTTPIYDKTEQTFALNCNKDYVKIDAVADLTVDDSGSTIAFKATKAKTYDVYAELKDKTLMEWNTAGDTANKPLKLTINKLKVAKPALTNAADETTGKEYISQTTQVSFALKDMGGYTAKDVTITATASSPTGGSVDGTSIKATNVGTYVFDVALADTDNTEWNATGGGTQPYTISVKITRKNVAIPAFISGANIKTYNGKDQTFSLTWNTSDIDIKDEDSNVVTSIVEKNAKEYTYTMNLKDTANTQWKDTSADVSVKELKFTMN
ncbi:MAG: hypothetical protein K2N18_04710, partial [Clostridia bacterium]|nr:hypothetical protein [Clostridia bacterium]